MENGKKRLGGVYMAAIHTKEGTVYYEKTRNRWRCDYKILDKVKNDLFPNIN